MALNNLDFNCLFTFLSPVLVYKLFQSRNCILLTPLDVSIVVVLVFKEKEQSLGKRRELKIEWSVGHDGDLPSGP